MFGYRKGYSTQNALIVMLEKWRRTLDKQGYSAAVLMDLSKAIDTINHDLLLAKLHAYGFDKKAILLIKTYLSNRWHRTKINSSFSSWKELLFGVPQGSVLGPLHIKNLKLLAIEMYKMRNQIQPCLLSEFVVKKETGYNLRNNPDFHLYDPKTVHLGIQSLSFLGPKIWELIPSIIKESPNLQCFKSKIRNWIPDNCPCRLCKIYVDQLGFL